MDIPATSSVAPKGAPVSDAPNDIKIIVKDCRTTHLVRVDTREFGNSLQGTWQSYWTMKWHADIAMTCHDDVASQSWFADVSTMTWLLIWRVPVRFDWQVWTGRNCVIRCAFGLDWVHHDPWTGSQVNVCS